MPNRTVEQRVTDLEEHLGRVAAVVEKLTKEVEIQLERIAQLQAELDQKRVATDKVEVVIEPAEKSD
jgi:uncharacterized coiled-coil protein SlyX